MKLIATMPCRNEDWCLGLTLRAALMACDEVIVLDHASTDQTPNIIREIINENPGRVFWTYEQDPVWNECQHRQRMLNEARRHGATHIALIDADEILTTNMIEDDAWRFRDIVMGFTGPSILQLPWICLARSIDRRYTEGTWGKNFVSCGFGDDPRAHWTAPGGYDFHHRHPMGVPPSFVRPMQPHEGGLMHLQFLSERRLKAKQALYKGTEVLRWPGRERLEVVNARYNPAVYESLPETQPTAEVPASWWRAYEPLMHHLRIDAEPWQEAEVRRLVREYGRERFAGLDLFGVA